MTEEEVLNSISEMFLDPNYTIPMMGCFRPIALKIVEKVVALLRLVPNLVSNSDDTMMEIGEEENGHFIEDYVRSEKGLMLHELACLAFCRALDLAPSLLGYVGNIFILIFCLGFLKCKLMVLEKKIGLFRIIDIIYVPH